MLFLCKTYSIKQLLKKYFTHIFLISYLRCKAWKLDLPFHKPIIIALLIFHTLKFYYYPTWRFHLQQSYNRFYLNSSIVDFKMTITQIKMHAYQIYIWEELFKFTYTCTYINIWKRNRFCIYIILQFFRTIFLFDFIPYSAAEDFTCILINLISNESFFILCKLFFVCVYGILLYFMVLCTRKSLIISKRIDAIVWKWIIMFIYITRF